MTSLPRGEFLDEPGSTGRRPAQRHWRGRVRSNST